jgi:thymidylate synthase (FAD)
MKTADIKVELLDTMGNDLTVANVARVSFDKQSEWEYDLEKAERILPAKDIKLINYLATHDHWSPFAHTFLSFRIKAPIFVARQLVKHQVGLSWNEVSRRYVDSEPEFFIPKEWRGRAENVKQGSSDAAVALTSMWAFEDGADDIGSHTSDALQLYLHLLDQGVAPEQARMVLPLNTMTEWVWSGSLMAFARVCKQRMDPHAQAECREVAEQIDERLRWAFPESTAALLDN